MILTNNDFDFCIVFVTKKIKTLLPGEQQWKHKILMYTTMRQTRSKQVEISPNY